MAGGVFCHFLLGRIFSGVFSCETSVVKFPSVLLLKQILWVFTPDFTLRLSCDLYNKVVPPHLFRNLRDNAGGGGQHGLWDFEEEWLFVLPRMANKARLGYWSVIKSSADFILLLIYECQCVKNKTWCVFYSCFPTLLPSISKINGKNCRRIFFLAFLTRIFRKIFLQNIAKQSELQILLPEIRVYKAYLRSDTQWCHFYFTAWCHQISPSFTFTLVFGC